MQDFGAVLGKMGWLVVLLPEPVFSHEPLSALLTPKGSEVGEGGYYLPAGRSVPSHAHTPSSPSHARSWVTVSCYRKGSPDWGVG